MFGTSEPASSNKRTKKRFINMPKTQTQQHSQSMHYLVSKNKTERKTKNDE